LKITADSPEEKKLILKQSKWMDKFQYRAVDRGTNRVSYRTLGSNNAGLFMKLWKTPNLVEVDPNYVKPPKAKREKKVIDDEED